MTNRNFLIMMLAIAAILIIISTLIDWDNLLLNYVILASVCLIIYVSFKPGKDKLFIKQKENENSNGLDETEHDSLDLITKKNQVEEYISSRQLNKKYKFELKGFSHYDTISLIEKNILGEYSSLRIVPEPDNEFDPFAVAVYFDTIKIGYVEKTRTKGALKLFSEGNDFAYIHNMSKLESTKFDKDFYFLAITIPYYFK